MAIQTIGIGTAPNDNTGDTPRTGITKLNANFTDTTNAASRLVQTSPSDATAGRVLTTDSTHTAAGVLYTGANFEPSVLGGLGVMRIMKNVSGATIGSGATVAASALEYAYFSGTTISSTTTAPSVGTFTQRVGTGLLNNNFGYFVRTA